MKAYLEGYYDAGTSSMRPVWTNQSALIWVMATWVLQQAPDVTCYG
ncbi:MAG: hypothetical protein IPO49_15925 [Bacteroidetes bacterium]|nr:hypothetical protein [Bacteroidota bacterium]